MRRSFSIGLVLAAALALSSSPNVAQYDDPDNAEILAGVFEPSTQIEVVVGEAVIVSPVVEAALIAAPQMQETDVLACRPADKLAGARCDSPAHVATDVLAAFDLRHALRGLDLVPLG